jgi:TPR repeat protein
MGILGKAGLAGVVLLGGVWSGGASAVEYSGVDLADKQLCLVAAKGTYKGSSSFIWDPKFKAYRNEAVKRGLTPEKCGLYFPVVQGTEASTPAPMTECDRLAAHPNDPKKLGAGVEWDKVDAISAIRACEAAVKAYPDAERLWFQLGRALHVQEDYNKSIIWYRKAIERGYAAAQNNLGVMYGRGEGVTKDYKEAVKWYRKAAEQGSEMAQNNLGVMYGRGEGVTKDYKEAVKWYRKAAEQGSEMAQNNLGTKYNSGEGVTKDYKEAVKWYRKAAEQGYAKAQNNLGAMLRDGKGIKQNYDKALSWFRKAAEQDHDTAKSNLKLLTKLLTDRGAESELLKRAEIGDVEAQYKVAQKLRNGGSSLGKSTEKAAKWFNKAAAQGHAKAQNKLGDMYEDGTGVKKNPRLAIKWFPAKSVTVFIDACFSGDSPKGMIVKSASGISLEARLPKSAKSMTVITAAQGDQLASWDEKAKHGLFTKHLLEALEGKADSKRYGDEDGKVSLAEVRNYLDQEMTYQARRRFGRTQKASVRGAPDTVLATVLDLPDEEDDGIEEMDAHYKALKTANIRSGPGTGFDIVGKLEVNQSVNVTGKVIGKNWFRLNDGTFVFGSLLGVVN